MNKNIQDIISLTKRRGFIYPGCEIYGGFGSSYDFGPLGLLFKNNLKKQWRQQVSKHEQVEEIDSAVVLHPEVWKASGHLSGFSDQLVECKECHKRFKEEDLDGKCPECDGELTTPKSFNLMMETYVGATEEGRLKTYLRPETCQGIFINFKNIVKSRHPKMPFGISQIGKSFRNEVNPKNFIFRTREFEQMELEWFCHPDNSDKWFDYWADKRKQWYIDLGIKEENLRVREVSEEERNHYARRQIDLEYKFPFGWREIEGIHDRTDYDLKKHSEYSGVDLKYYDQEKQEHFIPYIIETSVGVERAFLAFLCESYEVISEGRDKSSSRQETVLRLSPQLAPYQVAVFPLQRKEDLIEKAREVYQSLKDDFSVKYDQSGSIGKRYRRHDEIGTFLAITIDFDSLDDKQVTIRHRDTMDQIRVPIKELPTKVAQILESGQLK